MSTLQNTLTHVTAGSKLRYTCSLTAENTFTTITNNTTQNSTGTIGLPLYGSFLINLQGTWVANVYIQRSSDGGTTWYDVTTGKASATALIMTNNGERIVCEPARGVIYRVGIKTGGYTSGTVVISIEQ
jgi:hypothetical protein